MALAKYHRGRILAEMNRIEEAIQVYREAVKTQPDDYPPQSLYNLLGKAYSIAEMLSNFIVKERAKSNLYVSFYTFIFHYFSGEALFTKGNFLEAEFWYRKSLASKPDHLPAFLALAKLLSRLPGRTAEAEDLYRKAFKLEGDNPDVYVHYCKYLYFDTGDWRLVN